MEVLHLVTAKERKKKANIRWKCKVQKMGFKISFKVDRVACAEDLFMCKQKTLHCLILSFIPYELQSLL